MFIKHTKMFIKHSKLPNAVLLELSFSFLNVGTVEVGARRQGSSLPIFVNKSYQLMTKSY